jgi:ribosomal protein S1
MSWTKRVKHPKNLLNVGDDIECQVLEVDSKAKRISLSIKELEPDPWTLFVNEFNPGDKIGGKVRSITDYGIFIGIRDGVDGMVHKSDLSWTLRVNNPADLFQKNDDVEAVILSINHDEKKVSLGIKQLFDDPWSRIPNDYPPGKQARCRGRRVEGSTPQRSPSTPAASATCPPRADPRAAPLPNVPGNSSRGRPSLPPQHSPITDVARRRITLFSR